MSRINTLFLVTFFLTIITSCNSNKVEEPCDCENYYQISIRKNNALIEFHEAYTGENISDFLNLVLTDSLLFEDSVIEMSIEEFFQVFTVNISANSQFNNSPQIGFAEAKDTAAIKQVFERGQYYHWTDLYPIRFLWSKNPDFFAHSEEDLYALYAINTETADGISINEEAIKNATARFDANFNEQVVELEMNEKGKKQWGLYTQQNVGNFIAMISFNKVMSAPVINGPITGGFTVISGGMTKDEAEELSQFFNCSKMIRDMGKEDFEKQLRNCRKITPSANAGL
tara:strand:- start:19936 stop:20790 length:855 start_codon:yes stop_codon:yes gene_type:complete